MPIKKTDSLRGQGEVVEYTPEILEEIVKCKEDIIYFAEHYFNINSNKGVCPIQLREYQRRMLKAFIHPEDPVNKNNVICLLGRQSGKTTTASVFLVHYALFHEFKTVAILANKEDMAKEILQRVKFAYERLPKWLQQGIDEDKGGWTKEEICLENGCKIFISTTGSSAVRGRTLDVVFLDEFAFVPPQVADDFIKSVMPAITAREGSKVIMTSTPNGMNMFYDFWQKAVNAMDGIGRSSYFPIKVQWYEIEGRDENFKNAIIADYGIQFWMQEYACNFAGSSTTLVSSECIELIRTLEAKEFRHKFCTHIWERPMPDQVYIAGVDSGNGSAKDYSVVQILKIIDAQTYEQVARYRSNTTKPDNFAKIIKELCDWYNNCWAVVENNEVGGVTINHLMNDEDFDRIICDDRRWIGTKATKATKVQACLHMKKLLEDGNLTLHDKATVEELTRFVDKGNNVFQADTKRGHDDCVSGLYWACFYFLTSYFDPDNIHGEKEIESDDTLTTGFFDSSGDSEIEDFLRGIF